MNIIIKIDFHTNINPQMSWKNLLSTIIYDNLNIVCSDKFASFIYI